MFPLDTSEGDDVVSYFSKRMGRAKAQERLGGPSPAAIRLANRWRCPLAVAGFWSVGQLFSSLIPPNRTVKCTVEQPGVIGAYERTALYAKESGSSDGKWVLFDGSEAVVVGNLSEISDGLPVKGEPGN